MHVEHLSHFLALVMRYAQGNRETLEGSGCRTTRAGQRPADVGPFDGEESTRRGHSNTSLQRLIIIRAAVVVHLLLLRRPSGACKRTAESISDIRDRI